MKSKTFLKNINEEKKTLKRQKTYIYKNNTKY